MNANRAIQNAAQQTNAGSMRTSFCVFGGRYDHQRTLVIRIAARTLPSDSAIAIVRFCPSKEPNRSEEGSEEESRRRREGEGEKGSGRHSVDNFRASSEPSVLKMLQRSEPYPLTRNCYETHSLGIIFRNFRGISLKFSTKQGLFSRNYT